MTDETGESVHTIEQTHMIGQRASIRAFYPRDKEDMARLFNIIQDPEVQNWMDEVGGMSLEDVTDWAKQRGKRGQEECLFAISGSPEFVNKPEVGEVQGFVNVYRVDDETKRELAKMGMVSEQQDTFEISYARNPHTKPGQAASGVIQVCFRLNEMAGKKGEEISPSLPIVAFVDNQNAKSVNLLEHAGFSHAGKIGSDEVYKIDWQKAQNLLHTAADESILYKTAQ